MSFAIRNLLAVVVPSHHNPKLPSISSLFRRSFGNMDSFCKELPKVELHAHLNASLSLSTIRKLLRLQEELYPEEDLSLPEWLVESNSKEIPSDSFDDAFNYFSIVQRITNNPRSVGLATECVLEDFAADNVKYVELRSTPRSVENKMTMKEYALSVINAMMKIERSNVDIVPKYLLSVDRRKSIQIAEETVNLALELRELYPDIVVGLDLSGDARCGELLDFLPILKRAKERRLKIACHLAEVPNHEETRLIMDQLKPERIGHGTAIHPSTGGNEELWDLLKQLRIPLELCLTSNLKCKSVPSFDDHHMVEAHKADLPFVLATDGIGICQSLLSNEYQIACGVLKLSKAECFQLSWKSIEHIFADDKCKERLRSRWIEFKQDNHL